MPLFKEPVICPLGTLLNLLSGPWTFYILWIFRNSGPTRFGALKRQIEGISSKVLTERLRMLEEAEIIYREYKPQIPPEVTYGLTERGQDLIVILDQLDAIAHKWYEQEHREIELSAQGKSELLPPHTHSRS